jgi:hypothetical protein
MNANWREVRTSLERTADMGGGSSERGNSVHCQLSGFMTPVRGMANWQRNEPSGDTAGGVHGLATPLFPRRHGALCNGPGQEDGCAREAPRRDADADLARALLPGGDVPQATARAGTRFWHA